MVLVCIDPGHGGSDPGAVSKSGRREKDNNLAIAREIKKQENSLPGVNFIYTRLEDSLLAGNIPADLKARVKIANDAGADIYISIHQNADPNYKGQGVETYYFSSKGYTSEKGKRLASFVQKEIIKSTGLRDRGIKPGSFYVLRYTAMPAILVEAGFIGGDPKEAEYISRPDTLKLIAGAILRGAASYLGVEYQEIPQEPVYRTPIMGTPEVSKMQAKGFLEKMAPGWVFLVDIYYSVAPIYNVRADVALAQACKETDYFKFTGVVKPEFNNYCGLKKADAKGDSPSDHARFSDPETGVEAHIQHLYCYATDYPLPAGRKLVDPRFEIVAEFVGRGIAPTVEELGGMWAPDPDYGKSIVNDYLSKMLVFSLPEADEREKLLQEIDKLEKEKVQLINKINSLEDELDKKRTQILKLQGELDESELKIGELENTVNEMTAKFKKIAEIVSPYS